MIAPGVAQVFATKGYNVCIYARRAEALPIAVEKIRANLQTMAKKGLGSESEIDNIVGKVKTTTDLGEAVTPAHMVIECVAEDPVVKQNIFQQLDQLCSPDAILATNTSVISVSEIASKSKKKGRIVGTHFWNPPFLIPLVEVVKGKQTSNQTMDTTYQVLQSAGKHPVKCLKDVPGFIANRLQHALWREAVSIVENGIADAATVDEAIKNGFAVRLPILGPMENADMVGLDLTLSIHDYILKYLEDSHHPSRLLEEKVNRDELGFKTGQGFFSWTPEEAEKSRQRLLDYLLDWTLREQGKNKVD